MVIVHIHARISHTETLRGSHHSISQWSKSHQEHVSYRQLMQSEHRREHRPFNQLPLMNCISHRISVNVKGILYNERWNDCSKQIISAFFKYNI